MERTYKVICRNEKGQYGFYSTCSGFGIFDRVSGDLINQWEESANKETGINNLVVNFMRVKNPPTIQRKKGGSDD